MENIQYRIVTRIDGIPIHVEDVLAIEDTAG